jgi:hypothetical protein
MSEEKKSEARFLGTAPREKLVRLEYPFELDGQEWNEVRLRRATGVEVENYMDALQRGEKVIPPMFDFPMEVYDAMDDDDRFAVDEAVIPFLPRRLKAAAEQSSPAIGPTSDS